jgi:hypothetical protein
MFISIKSKQGIPYKKQVELSKIGGTLSVTVADKKIINSEEMDSVMALLKTEDSPANKIKKLKSLAKKGDKAAMVILKTIPEDIQKYAETGEVSHK